jgi:hypothetical protein
MRVVWRWITFGLSKGRLLIDRIGVVNGHVKPRVGTTPGFPSLPAAIGRKFRYFSVPANVNWLLHKC